MGVEQREGCRLRYRCPAAEAHPALRCLQLLRLSRTVQRLQPIERQERGTGQRQRARQGRALSQSLCHPHDARSDQHCVCHCTEQHDAAYVLAAQTLAQHERILRTDRHDEAEAQSQPLGKNGKEHGLDA
ncbi:hypothetical protein D9M71_660150 [compost metagenome]